MNQKTTRKYELITEIGSGVGEHIKNLMELVAIDFTTAFDMWEFALSRGCGAGVVNEGLDVFMRASEQKAKTEIAENGALQKLIFSSPHAGMENVISFLASFIVANKTDEAGKMLSVLRANTYLDFNDTMRAVVDSAFNQSCVKNQTRVPQFNKKQKTLLLEYIEKIKGPNKALLLQRMKEI